MPRQLPKRRARHAGWTRHLYWAIPLLVVDVMLFGWIFWKKPFERERPRTAHAPVETIAPAPVVPSALARAAMPTRHPALVPEGDWTSALQPTASGRLESARYGSTRTGLRRGRLRPAFHEGLDIAPATRDRRGNPTDDILAVADGRIAYINRIAGNSNYGLYLVLLHDDPLGPVYTLYAHLADIPRALRVGDAVQRGDRLGRMGCTPDIPRMRGHLHFEIGLLLNNDFDRWRKAQKIKPGHGVGHGWNLYGLDPETFLCRAATDETFTVKSWLGEQSPAWTVLARMDREPDAIRRYPSLWRGESFQPGGWVVLESTANGVPLCMRKATEAECTEQEDGLILAANETLLEGDGAALVVRDQGRHRLTREGRRWLDILRH